ncbi:MAG: tripartite tricarboxylate transporter substrate binding protein [Propionivibrio sp.]
MFKKSLIFFYAIATLSIASGPAKAEFPERTIEMIFPWSAGTAMAVTQVITTALGEELSVSVPVISTPGAAGTKAFQTAMGRDADGYTLIDGYVAPLVLQPILGNASWTYKDFKPLHSGVSNAFSIGGRPSEKRWSNFKEMMAWGNAHPGKLRYSSGSRNNLPHMVIAKTLQSFGVVAQNIPYKTDADAVNDMKGGILDFVFMDAGSYRQDKPAVKILLVLSELPKAKAIYDGAPSINELDIDLGLSGLAPMGWDWFVVRKDTPDNVVDRLNKAMNKVMQRSDVRKKIENIGYIPLEWTSADYEKIIAPVVVQLTEMGNALKWEETEMAKLK